MTMRLMFLLKIQKTSNIGVTMYGVVMDGVAHLFVL